MENSAICMDCGLILDLPVALPCGNCVCKKHIKREYKIYNCAACKKIHVVPEEGFNVCKVLENLINTIIKQSKLRAEYEEALGCCKHLKNSIDSFYLLVNNPSTLVRDTLSEFKSKVNFLRENFKAMIDEKAEEIIEETNNYEQECVRESNRIKYNDDDIRQISKELESWTATLSPLNSGQDDLNTIKVRSKIHLNDIEAMVNAFKSALFLRKLDDFKLKFNDFSNIDLKLSEEKVISELKYEKVSLDSAILDKTQIVKLMELCEFSAHHNWQLLYRAVGEDEFSSNKFHETCDNIPNTLCIIKSTSGFLFGGYAQATWNENTNYKSDQHAFLFSLVNHLDKPVKIQIKKEKINSAICSYLFYGPTFGSGHDLVLTDNENPKYKSYSNLGDTYELPSFIINKAQATIFLAGSYEFKISDVEVFQKLND